MKVRRIAAVSLAMGPLALIAACTTPPSGPPDSADVGCTAGDSLGCTTGELVSGTTKSTVTLNDADGLTGQLTASIGPGTVQCDEYTSTSKEVTFDFVRTSGTPTPAMTKTLVLSEPVPDARPANQYQVCFQGPQDFPALLPSQLGADFDAGDFSGNTQFDGTNYRGLLLPCSAGYGVPCLAGRVIAGGTITVTVTTPVGDPRLRV